MSRVFICEKCGFQESRKNYRNWREVWDKIQGKNIHLCQNCRPVIWSKPKLEIPGTPQELRKKASELYQIALRADRNEYYHREMNYVQALRDEADRREAELHY